jgi:hypothetical protein
MRDESIRRTTPDEALPVADLMLRSRSATVGIPPGSDHEENAPAIPYRWTREQPKP